MSVSVTGNGSLIRPWAILLVSLVLASALDNLLASWLRLSPPADGDVGVYRRVGPETGPQALCAGSSLVVSALSWSEVSGALGRGIETWGVGGSSPEIWEVWQQQRPLSNTTIIGVSVYDLNEMHLADQRAYIIPLSRTINDVWTSHADSALSHRLLTQYLLKYVRLLFPTAGHADKLLIAVRSKVAGQLGLQASLAEHEGVVLEPNPPILDAGESTEMVSTWSSARLLRRIAVLEAENRGRHEFFNGPKHIAFQRMLVRARRQGRVIVVVLPVSRAYTEAFLDKTAAIAFERVIQDAMEMVPEATFVRLDRVRELSDPSYFFDLVHMNSLGRRLATQAFLMEVGKKGLQQSLGAAHTESVTPGN